MAKDTFANVPNSTGGIRGISRQIAAVLAFNRKDGTKNGLSYDEHSALENQRHVQGIQRDVVGSVLASEAADKAHKSALAQNRQKNKQALGQIAATGEQDRNTATHLVDHFERLGTSKQYSNLNVGKTGVSGTFTKPDTPGVNLDS
jgi:hypothetical protein